MQWRGKYSWGDLHKLMHRWLDHLSEKRLDALFRHNLLPLKVTHLKSCTHCSYGKQHKVSFHNLSSYRRSYVLDLIHTNVCSMPTKILGGALYFVTFVDDHSWKLWAFALKSKDQVFYIFKEFYASVEIEKRKKLRCIRIDNDGKYQGSFKKYCG